MDCFERIKAYLQKQQLTLSADMARDAVANASGEPVMQSLPVPPSKSEQLLHELTQCCFSSDTRQGRELN